MSFNLKALLRGEKRPDQFRRAESLGNSESSSLLFLSGILLHPLRKAKTTMISFPQLQRLSRASFSAFSASRQFHSSSSSQDHRIDVRAPTLQDALQLPIKFRECDNDIIFSLSIHGVHGARKERLLREIMVVDNLDWSSARSKLEEMDQKNDQFRLLVKAPYKIGLFLGFGAAVSAIPLVFHRDTALWFNETFVKADLPDDGLADLDTFWNVGSWTWGWMEPYLGTASFVLLGLQFSRAQMQKMDWKPYTEAVLSWRANRLADQYPQYNRVIVRDFAKSDPWN